MLQIQFLSVKRMKYKSSSEAEMIVYYDVVL